MLRIFFMAVGAIVFIQPAWADDFVGRWEGRYFCNGPNPVGRMELEITSQDGQLRARETYRRGQGAGTVFYTGTRGSQGQITLRIDTARTRDVRFPYQLKYRLSADRKLLGDYVGHKNCQRTELSAVGGGAAAAKSADTRPNSPPASRQKAAAPAKEQTLSIPQTSGRKPDWEYLDAKDRRFWGEFMRRCPSQSPQGDLGRCLGELVALSGTQRQYVAARLTEGILNSASGLGSCLGTKHDINASIAAINRFAATNFSEVANCREAAAIVERAFGFQARWSRCEGDALPKSIDYERYASCMKLFLGFPDDEAVIRRLSPLASGLESKADVAIGGRQSDIEKFKELVRVNYRYCAKRGETDAPDQWLRVIARAWMEKTETSPPEYDYPRCEFLTRFAEEAGIAMPVMPLADLKFEIPDKRLLDLADRANAPFGLEHHVTLGETSAFNLYGGLKDKCAPLVLDVRKTYATLADLVQAVQTEHAERATQVAVSFGCHPEAARGLAVRYFGTPVFDLQGADVRRLTERPDWKVNELPDEANFNILLGEVVGKERPPEEIYQKLVRAIRLGSRSAGHTLAFVYGNNEYVSKGYFRADPAAPRTEMLRFVTAFAVSMARQFERTVKDQGGLPSAELSWAVDWAKANPHGNPLTVTEDELFAAVSPETRERLAAPTGEEIFQALRDYYISICSPEGYAKHAEGQRGDLMSAAPGIGFKPAPNGCTITRFGTALTLGPGSVHRESCTTAGMAEGSYKCRISFQMDCGGHETVCRLIRPARHTGEIELATQKGGSRRSWQMTELIFDGEYKRPPPSAEWSHCDGFRGAMLTRSVRRAVRMFGC